MTDAPYTNFMISVVKSRNDWGRYNGGYGVPLVRMGQRVDLRDDGPWFKY
jgi:hypothetical protein